MIEISTRRGLFMVLLLRGGVAILPVLFVFAVALVVGLARDDQADLGDVLGFTAVLFPVLMIFFAGLALPSAYFATLNGELTRAKCIRLGAIAGAGLPGVLATIFIFSEPTAAFIIWGMLYTLAGALAGSAAGFLFWLTGRPFQITRFLQAFGTKWAQKPLVSRDEG